MDEIIVFNNLLFTTVISIIIILLVTYTYLYIYIYIGNANLYYIKTYTLSYWK